MKLTDTTIKWILWILLTTLIGVWLSSKMMSETADKTIFMPGALSDGHHQLAERCDVCHTDTFGGTEIIQEACIDCHGKERVKPFDSHPAKKFKDPRNADLLEDINALSCITCHTEHRQEITAKNGLTQPGDFCFHCHADVAEERPSHEGMGFDTCASSGCHNFHDNRAIYTNFLLKHIDKPWLEDDPSVLEKQFLETVYEMPDYPVDEYPVQHLSQDDIDAPDKIDEEGKILGDWLASAHAEAGVNCTACHVTATKDEEPMWSDDPGMESCQQCHGTEIDRFMRGKHGMRLKHGLPPMTPEHARLPMHETVAHEELTCETCHGAHSYDVSYAATESCLQCHSDEHSLAYEGSPHHIAWQREIAGEAAPNTGVSCATCHMPRIDYDVSEWSSRTIVDHNQSAAFSPNTKMVRSSCIHCHGLEFTLDSLSDEEQISKNFNGKPKVHIRTMDLAREEDERRKEEQGDDAGMFGF